jgi:hypothetical protein
MGEGLVDYRRLEQLEERELRTEDKVIQLDKSIAVYSAIFERNLQIQEKLSTAIDRLAETINSIQQTLIGVIKDTKTNSELQQSNSNKIVEIEVTTDKKITELELKLHTKMDKLDGKIDDVDDKGKFDFLKFMKENLLSITLFLYIVYDGIKGYISTK